MLTMIHNHFNIRALCKVDLPVDVLVQLDKPPAGSLWADHVVRIDTPSGALDLFRVEANGVRYVVTSTPDVALANAAT